MCGIAGIWGSQDEDAVRRMMDVMRHRGPDASGTYVDERRPGVLGHQRLSIMDPEGGDQPILGGRDRLAIVGNGEIYNHRELRETMPDAPYKTDSDTETALHVYGREKEGTAEALDGMFAFAIADGGHLYAARDHIGIKPLYFGRRGKALCFASELKALAGVAENVEALPPGSYFDSRHGVKRYYEVPDCQPENRPAEAFVSELREVMERSVRKWMMSDVPIGSFLSGGLDSSLIAAMARRELGELHTFAVGIEGSNDIEAARHVAGHIGSIHHEHFITVAEVLEHLPEIIYCLESFDADLVRSAIPTYFTSRLAAEHVKVIMTGEGADELFAGYAYHKDIRNPLALHRELRRSITAMHNVNLQRVDRLTMAHSIEGRVPFLDKEMIDLSMRIPPQLKLPRGGDGPPMEKWVLRKAVEDLLPHDIVWRVKEQFDEGSGTVDLLTQEVERLMPSSEAEAYMKKFPEANLRSAEECAYHRILRECFGGDNADAVVDNVGRWAERPAA